MLFRHNHRFYNALLGGMVVALFFLNGCGALLGILGALLDLFFPDKGAENLKLLTSKKLFDRNNIICLQEVHGKDEFLQAIQVVAPQFRFFGTFLLENEKCGRDYLSRPPSSCEQSV